MCLTVSVTSLLFLPVLVCQTPLPGTTFISQQVIKPLPYCRSVPLAHFLFPLRQGQGEGKGKERQALPIPPFPNPIPSPSPTTTTPPASDPPHPPPRPVSQGGGTPVCSISKSEFFGEWMLHWCVVVVVDGGWCLRREGICCGMYGIAWTDR